MTVEEIKWYNVLIIDLSGGAIDGMSEKSF